MLRFTWVDYDKWRSHPTVAVLAPSSLAKFSTLGEHGHSVIYAGLPAQFGPLFTAVHGAHLLSPYPGRIRHAFIWSYIVDRLGGGY